MSREPLSRASRRSPTDVQREYVEHITDELLSGEAGFSHGVALLIALKIERDDARAEAAMAGAAEDGAMASANDLLERLDKAEAAREAWQADAERLREALGHVKMHGRINESMPGHEYGYTDNCHFCPAIAAHDSLVAKHKSASLAAEGFRGEDLLKEKKQGV